MSYEFGNYKREKEFGRYQVGRMQKVDEEKRSQQVKGKEQEEPIKFETKKAEASCLEALGAYGFAFSEMGKKVDVSVLGLTKNDQMLIAKFVTPEQQARIEESMLSFFV